MNTQMELDLFELERAEKLSKKDEIYRKLRHYGVDDYYKNNIKREFMLLSAVREKLSNLPGYDNYLSSLIKELSEIVPSIPRGEWVEKRIRYSCLLETDTHYRYYCQYIDRGSSIGVEGALFCLEGIPDDFFLGGL